MRRRAAWATGLTVLPAGCALVYLNDPDGSGLYPTCPFRAATGLDCPVCGSARALHALLHGRPAEAASFNVLAVAVLPFVLYGTVSALRYVVGGRTLPSWRPSGRVVWGLMTLAGLFAVVRNLPFGPGPWLAS